MSKPIVAIVGRPNVGKSTLFNRLVGKPFAIVADEPGTTRDRIIADMSWQGVDFTVVDTGGLEPRPGSQLVQLVKDQVDIAINEADVIIFVVSVLDGITAADLEIADLLRRSGKPVVLTANKADNPARRQQAPEFYQLGIGDPFTVSAYHGGGTGELLSQVVSLLPPPTPALPQPQMMKVAIVGRPNVGKSSLLNAILGQERAIVTEVPGTTRDALDTIFEYGEDKVLLIDTAGIRRRGRVERGIESYGVIRALRAIDRADVALLVLEAPELITAQDLHVAGYLQQSYKGVVVVVNKWDLAENKDKDSYIAEIRDRLKFLHHAQILFASAKLGLGIKQILPAAVEVCQERQKRVPTAQLNSLIESATVGHTLPRSGKRQLKVLYVTQADVNPPTFVFFVNDPRLVHFSFQRYLENRLRQAFGFAGTPLRLVFRRRGEQ
jgi:GTP-binding protein